MSANRYAGRCADCGTQVDAGEGVYDNGTLRCGIADANTMHDVNGEAVIVATYACPRYQAAEAQQVAQARAARAAYKPSAEEIAAQAARHQQWAQEDAAWAARGLTRCRRCGGGGGNQAWPGFTCYDCAGVGAVAVTA